MLEVPYFSDLLLKSPSQIGSEGIIFPSPFVFKESWSAGHILIAQFAFKVAFAGTLRRTCMGAVSGASPTDPEHSIFLARMFHFLISGSHRIPAELPLATEIFKTHEEQLCSLAIRHAEAMAEWAPIFRAFGESELEERCLVNAKLTNPHHALNVIQRLDQLGKARDAIAAAARWFDSSPDDTFVRSYYLAMVDREGTRTDVQRTIALTADWLGGHADDTSVRRAYLGLIERNGTPKELRDVIVQTANWLGGHADDTLIRRAYLGLIEIYGTPKELQNVIVQTANWLGGHADDTLMRGAYIGLIERYGHPEELQDVIAQTEVWLAGHTRDTYVRAAFLDLIEQKGTPLQIAAAIDQTATWLNTDQHDDDNYVRTIYLGLVERHGTAKELQNAIEQTKEWLSRHSEDMSVRTAFLDLIEQKGGHLQLREAIVETRKWLDGHDDSSNVRTFYLGLVERRSKEDLDAAIEDTDRWLRQHLWAKDVWNSLIAVLVRNQKVERAIETTSAAIKINPRDLNLLERYLDLVAYQGSEQETATIFDELEARFPTNSVIPLKRARWLSDAGRSDEAEDLYAKLLKKYPRWADLRHALGRHYLRLKRLTEARKAFEGALGLNIRHQMAHEGKAQALRGLAALAMDAGNPEYAQGYLKLAESHFRSAITWAGRQSAPVARFHASIGWFYLDQGRCEEALSSFEAAIREAPEHFSNYWGRGAALKGLGRPSEAVVALETALAKAPQPLESPAKEKIPGLLEECRRDLE